VVLDKVTKAGVGRDWGFGREGEVWREESEDGGCWGRKLGKDCMGVSIGNVSTGAATRCIAVVVVRMTDGVGDGAIPRLDKGRKVVCLTEATVFG
jgi:hypothetical protein